MVGASLLVEFIKSASKAGECVLPPPQLSVHLLILDECLLMGGETLVHFLICQSEVLGVMLLVSSICADE